VTRPKRQGIFEILIDFLIDLIRAASSPKIRSSPFSAARRGGHYSGFDSSLYKILDAKWHFSQENATLRHLQMTTFESKPL
jgi:hypothetical protein